MLLPPSCRAGWIFRDLSLPATGTPSGRQIGLSRLLPKCPELLEKLTLPGAVAVTQETISQHQTSPQEGARVLPELCSLVLKKVSERFWPLGLRRVTGHISLCDTSQLRFFFPFFLYASTCTLGGNLPWTLTFPEDRTHRLCSSKNKRYSI